MSDYETTQRQYRAEQMKGYHSDHYSDGQVTRHGSGSGTKPQKTPKPEKTGKSSSRKSSQPEPDPIPLNADDSYELCVASDAELHTHGRQVASQHYFSLPHTHHNHGGHRSGQSQSPRTAQTMTMRPPHTLYRRAEDYEYAYNHTA